MSQKPSLNAFLLSFIPFAVVVSFGEILMLLAKDVKLNWLVGASHFDEMKCIKPIYNNIDRVFFIFLQLK